MKLSGVVWAIPICLLLLLNMTGGCAAPQSKASAAANAPATITSTGMTRAELDSEVRGFADNFTVRMAGCYDQIALHAATPQQRYWAMQNKAGQALAAVTAASGPNPAVNLLDLIVMVTLKRMSVEEYFGPDATDEQAQDLLAAYKQSETEIWILAAGVFSPAQITELHGLIATWKKNNPKQSYVGFVRFSDFANAATTAKQSGGQFNPGSILGILNVDPLAGLSPIEQEAQEYRQLAERMVYISLRMPTILSWQVEYTAAVIMNEPPIQQMQATAADYGKAMNRFNDIVAAYPQDYAAATHALVDQIAKATTSEREATIDQISQTATEQREATVKELDAQAKNLQSVLDETQRSIVLARNSALDINASTAQTITLADAATRSILTHTMVVVVVILVVGIGWPAAVLFGYRYCTRRWLPPPRRHE
jgi:hypothetical protein